MRYAKRIGLWLWAGVFIAALAMPNFVPAAASTANDEWGIRMARTRAWIEDWTATRAPRPPVDLVQQQQTTAQWTVMVYISADNNLEISGLFDVNEMEAVGSSPDVNILVEIDRSEDYVDDDGDWTETRRYYIQQDDNLDVISSPVVENLGEIDSGSADSVADFAIWGISNYPAEKYMLVLWDHGGGWVGMASDDDSDESIVLPELAAGLERVKTETGIAQFEVLGFDMCLMGQLEVFQTVAPYARYGIGSQESEPGVGWFYVFLDEMVRNPQMDGAQVGKHVVDYFMYFLGELLKSDDLYGLAAIDLSQGGAVLDAVGQFTAAVNANPQAALSPVADARNNTISYGGSDDPQYYDYWSSVDLYQFAEKLNSISTSPELQQAAQAVMQAVDNAVVYEQHVEQLDGSHGVSIYFPRTMKAYKTLALNERYPVEAPASMAMWVEFLDVFHGTAATTVTSAPTVDVLSVYPDVASIYQPAVVTMEVSGRDILQVNYAVSLITGENERVVLDFDYLVSRTTTPDGNDIVNWSDGVTTRTFIWEAEVPKLTDGSASTYALLIPTRDNPNVALVNGEYTSVRGGDPLQAQLLFDLNTRQSTALWGINETASGALQPFELQVEAGDQFRPIWLTLDANNDLASSSFGDVLTLTDAKSISFEKVPAPTGRYSVSFVAENVKGDKTMDETIIEVNNEGLDPVLRGYTDLTFGVNFLYPAAWIRPRFSPDGTRLFTADLATNTILSLYPYTDVSSAEETDAAIRASWNELENLQINNERSLEINGLPAFVTDYAYTFNGETRVGAVIAIYEPNQAVGYAFDLDAPASNPAPAQEALAVLADSINFFQTAEVVGQSGWQTATPAGAAVSFPVPVDWTEETSGDWTLYGPQNNPAVFVGLATQSASGLTNAELAQNWVNDLQANVANFQILASEPFYIGNREWHVVVFLYEADVKVAGAFFTTTDGQHDYTFWIEAPDADFDQLYADVFAVTIGGFAFTE